MDKDEALDKLSRVTTALEQMPHWLDVCSVIIAEEAVSVRITKERLRALCAAPKHNHHVSWWTFYGVRFFAIDESAAPQEPCK